MSEKKTKTKKVVKRRLKLKGVLFLASIFVGIFLIYKIGSNLKISETVISGNTILKDSEIMKETGLNKIDKIFGFSTRKTCKNLLKNKLVKTCKIKRTTSLKVKVIIEENPPLFYYTHENVLILSDGQKIEKSNTYGVPTLINMVPSDILDRLIAGLSDIDSDIIRSVSEIKYDPIISKKTGQYTDKEHFVLMMNDGNTVHINNENIENFNYYEEMYASNGDKKGTYYLNCDFNNMWFSIYTD